MRDAEIERKIRPNYPTRNRKLWQALHDGVRRTSEPVRSGGDKCAVCTWQERGGGASGLSLARWFRHGSLGVAARNISIISSGTRKVRGVCFGT